MKSPFLTAQLTSSLSGACACGLDLGEFEGTVSVGGRKNGKEISFTHRTDRINTEPFGCRKQTFRLTKVVSLPGKGETPKLLSE